MQNLAPGALSCWHRAHRTRVSVLQWRLSSRVRAVCDTCAAPVKARGCGDAAAGGSVASPVWAGTRRAVMPGTLTSKRFKVDDMAAAVDFCFDRGWSDGLPVVPPTESAVRAMLDAIGRAVRLVMRNVCGSMPGLLDRGTVGHPGKLSYVIAENEAESPWTPLHVERGFRPEQSTVTVMAAEGPHQFYNQLSSTAEGVLITLADSMRISGNVMGQPHYCLVLAGEHMKTIAADGWDKKRIRQFVWEHTQNAHAHLKRTQRMAGAPEAGDESRMRPLVAAPDDILVVAAGGRAGAFSCFIPGWSSAKSSAAITKEIKR